MERNPPRRNQIRPSSPTRAELDELDEELEDELLEFDELDELLLDLDDDELLLELDELLLELDELDEPLLELEDELDGLEEELDGRLELEDPSGAVGLPSSHACSSMPRPAKARLPERIRRNCRRSSRCAVSSGPEGFLNIVPTSTSLR